MIGYDFLLEDHIQSKQAKCIRSLMYFKIVIFEELKTFMN